MLAVKKMARGLAIAEDAYIKPYMFGWDPTSITLELMNNLHNLRNMHSTAQRARRDKRATYQVGVASYWAILRASHSQ